MIYDDIRLGANSAQPPLKKRRLFAKRYGSFQNSIWIMKDYILSSKYYLRELIQLKCLLKETIR
jgi:phosphatidylserine/phosphatidylglycerophosphate/cardiolipin synthase-like enzyme